MSWEAWKNQIKTNSSSHPCADSCGIFDPQGNPWVKEGARCDQLNSANFTTFENLVSNGMGSTTSVAIGGDSFMLLGADTEEKVISGKKGQGGFTVARCNTCYVVGFYSDSSITPGNNKTQVCVTQTNLKNAGY